MKEVSRLIEWIFNNIPLIIVILGGLLSLFNKSGERDTSTPPIRPLPKEAKLEKQPMEPKNESPFEMIQQEVEKI